MENICQECKQNLIDQECTEAYGREICKPCFAIAQVEMEDELGIPEADRFVVA